MRLAAALVMSAALLAAQEPPEVSGIVFTAPAPASPSPNLNYNGSPGTTVRCYRVAANYPRGTSAFSGAVCYTGLPPSAVDTAVISWSGLTGATSYDVLRLPSATANTTCSDCLLADDLTARSFTDDGSVAGGAYTTPTPPSAVRTTMAVDNVGGTAPFLNFNLLSANTRIPVVNWAESLLNNPVSFGPNGSLIQGVGPAGNIANGAALDVPCYTSASTLGPCATGDFTYDADLVTIKDGTAEEIAISARNNPSITIDDDGTNSRRLRMRATSSLVGVGSPDDVPVEFFRDNDERILLNASDVQIFPTGAAGGSAQVRVGGSVRYGNSAGEPENCTAAIYGTSYYNTVDERLCICSNDGVVDEWLKSDDYSPTGHCTL